MSDPNLSRLLKWGIKNSSQANENAPADAPAPSGRGLNPEMLSTLFGGPTDADLMKASMSALRSDEVDLENKLVAFDNFEQLVENIDNANNMEPLGLWTQLVELLNHEEADMRRMAAWCVGTAVQNNEKGQDKVVVLNVIPRLVGLATSDRDQSVRKKACFAVSSAVRNYQPAMDELTKHLPEGEGYPAGEKVDAGNMDAIDGVMDKLRAHPVAA